MAGAIREAGGEARVLATDVTDPDQVVRLVGEAEAAFGRLDILVNNAGVGYFGPVESTPIVEVRRLLDTNVLGTLYGIQAAVPVMRRRGGGHIVTISSISGKRGTPGSGMYAATKFAQVALSEALRLELASTGIRVTLVCPVSTLTEFFEVAARRSPLAFQPMGPTYTADEVAAKILSCLRRPRPERMVFAPARVMVILNAVSPRFTDWLLTRVGRRLRPGC